MPTPEMLEKARAFADENLLRDHKKWADFAQSAIRDAVRECAEKVDHAMATVIEERGGSAFGRDENGPWNSRDEIVDGVLAVLAALRQKFGVDTASRLGEIV